MNTPLLLGKIVSFLNSCRAQLLPSPHSNKGIYLSSPSRDSDQLQHRIPIRFVVETLPRNKHSAGILVVLATFFLTLSTAWAQVDLSLSKKIDNSKPAIGETVTYSIIVKNTGLLPATGVVVKDSLPMGGVTYLGNVLVLGG
ncbi:DUF11 domain-containing protein [Salmonirosea aquatica]|uniref:DUF11 domain-containing protein n=1 Tax=Salmonirosea aquatica TaxID=2654236 RepID=A0A7C9BEQ9_9BACT|nr:DUF11 domain-containing protein [Cytophagaceae bacterium SJW1-29]